MLGVLAIVPLADYLIDPNLKNPSRVTRMFVDAAVTLHIRPGFWAFGLLFAVANLVKGGLDIATRYSILRIKYAVVRGLFADSLKTFFKARWEFFSSVDQGKLLNTLNKELNSIGENLGQLGSQAARVVQLAIYLTVPIWLNARMTLTAVGLALLFGSPLLLLWKVSYRLGQRTTHFSNVMMGVLNEILAAARLILGYGRQEQSRKRFLRSFDDYVGATLHYQAVDISTAAFFTPVGILAAVIALGFALQSGSPVSEMTALLWSMLRVLPLLGQLLSTHVTINGLLPSYEQLASLRKQAADVEEMEGEKVFSALEHGLEFHEVDFAYPTRGEAAVKKMSLRVQKGKMTALVGESGSGKSTVTDLLLGLQIPSLGEVTLDGLSLELWKQNSFRQRVGYVPQEPLLFNTTIRENLLWSAPSASEEDLWTACRMANAEVFVKDLPAGLDTEVGDRGARLSGGQRQRIALARALVRKPELLILDEATSALDSESERLIQKSINDLAQDATVLIIAHRLSTIARADYVYVLRAGAVVEEGSYRELSRKQGGVLSGMIAVQQVLEPEIESRLQPSAALSD